MASVEAWLELSSLSYAIASVWWNESFPHNSKHVAAAASHAEQAEFAKNTEQTADPQPMIATMIAMSLL